MFWYGEEIGMGDMLSLDGRGSVRTPMQWSGDANGVFSTADADRLIRPVIADGPYAFSAINVARQQRNPESLLSWVERALRTRRACREFGWGTCDSLDLPSAAVLAHRCQHAESSVLVVHTLSEAEQEISLPLREGRNARDLLSRDSDLVGSGTLTLRLPPFDYRWLRECDARQRG